MQTNEVADSAIRADRSEAAPVKDEQPFWAVGAANCAYAYDQFKSHPVETTGLGLLALLAIRVKSPKLEQLALEYAGTSEAAAKAGAADAVVAKVGTAETSVVKAPNVITGGVPAAGAEAGKGAAEVAKAAEAANPETMSGLHPDFVSRLSGERMQIPSFTVDGLNTKIFSPQILNVAKDSVEAEIYQAGKDSTFQIFAKGRGPQGTGFLVDDSGIVATANHVVEDGRRRYFVALASGEQIPARLIGRDVRADVALLKIDRLSDLPEPFMLSGATTSLQKGRSVFLLGKPDQSAATLMTKGKIFGLERVSRPGWEPLALDPSTGKPVLTGIIRHTAEGWTGSSGGPLVLDSGLVSALHTTGIPEGQFFRRATSSFHIDSLMGDVLSRPMVPRIQNVQTDIRGFRMRVPKYTPELPA